MGPSGPATQKTIGQFLSQNYVLGQELACGAGMHHHFLQASFLQASLLKKMRGLFANRLPRIVRTTILGQELASRLKCAVPPLFHGREARARGHRFDTLAALRVARTDIMADAPLRQFRFTTPAGATEMILVRHGESAAVTPGSPLPLLDGHGNSPLGEVGVAQAERIAQRLHTLPIAAVYVTPLVRTHQTAAPLCDRLGQPFTAVPDLIEIGLGDWEGGMFRVKAAAADPVFAEMNRRERWDVIPGAECDDLFAERLDRAVGKIAAAHADELVVLVVHGGVVGSILARATGSRGFAFKDNDNGSISRIVVAEDLITVRSFNDVSHV